MELIDVDNREQILRIPLMQENLKELFNFKEVAAITEGFLGSDLKTKAQGGSKMGENGIEPVLALRPIAMKDMKAAKNEVSASYASEGARMNELKHNHGGST
eukprot:TRINITY_DN11067_c0_g1_i2.p1 TRINITY_DN11067_c0_g1~~TRINITY_DN11067_c0_g1_i2.p1  ORF type:complete len:102 (+),score=24.55 TRINITY_DN11067_c0_g1_i2:176-481(+)